PAIHLYDVTTGKELRQIGLKNRVFSQSFSSDGKTLAVGCEDKVHFWETATGGRRLEILPGGTVTSVAFSPDDTLLVSADHYRDEVRLWDVATGEERHRYRGHRGGVTSVAFSPDGKWLASGSRDTTVLIWDVAAAL